MRHLTADDTQTEKNQRGNVLRLLLDHQWHQTIEIVAAGGTEGTRRLRELRQPPFNYRIERSPVLGSRQWQYRLLPSENA